MDNGIKLNRLLNPKHVCFVGGSTMADAVKRCKAGGFKGDIWLVNPKHKEINGIPCFQSIADLPEAPDASLIGTNRNVTIDIVHQLNERGAGGAVCYASGFGESGDEGEALQVELLKAAGNMPILGPNCYGLLDFLHGTALWPVAYGGELVEKGVAILTQSGNFAYNISMLENAPQTSYLISVGNQAQVGVHHLIDALIDDPRVTAIGLHLEGLKDVPAFTDAVIRALQKKVPIVVMKSGSSSIGANLAMSHTGSLAGSDELYTTLFERVGAIRVNGPVSFIETLKLLQDGKLPKGRRVSAMANSGGDAGMIADYCEKNGLELPPLSESKAKRLKALLPEFAHVANPLDFTTAIWGDEDALSQCAEIMFESDTDLGFLALDFPTESSGEQSEYVLMADVFQKELQKNSLPGAIASIFPELMPINFQKQINTSGLPAISGIEAAMEALGHVVKYKSQRETILARLDGRSATTTTANSITADTVIVDEWDSKLTLADHGLTIPKAYLGTATEISAAADSIGYPAVVKVVSSDLPHKTEAGAVALKLMSASEVLATAEDMVERISVSHPQVDTQRLMVEKMSPPPVAEFIVGIKRETGFGLALVIGAGGILVELVKDSTNLLLPTTEEAIEEALQKLKIYKILQGFRGKPGGDIKAAVKAIMSIADYAVENAESIVELDVNPLMILEEGAVAVDALIRKSQ